MSNIAASNLIYVAQKNLEHAAVEPDTALRSAYLETANDALSKADGMLKQSLSLHIQTTIHTGDDISASEVADQIRQLVGRMAISAGTAY